MTRPMPSREGFERNEREQLLYTSRLTPLQRLQWLQQAKEFARKYAGAAAKPATPAPKK